MGALVTDPAVTRETADAGLVERIAAGDTDALRELYDLYGSVVFGMALRILGDRQLAEDCTQEVFVAVWRGAGRYDAERALTTTWLFTLTRNKAIDIARWQQRRRAESLPESWQHEHAPDSLDVVAAAEHGERVAAALAELPRPQLETLVLAYFGQLSQAEIAERLAVPLGTVKSRMRVGLERLRMLSPKYALELEEGS
jgi:RNA polymerase sigma-70 factor (ECF subfamily)